MPAKKPVAVNDEFDLNAKLTPEELAEQQAFDAETEQGVRRNKAKQKAKFIDPEDDRKNWPTIRIEDEVGMPNYALLISGGTKKSGKSFTHEIQVMRNKDVQVPPSIVYNLQDAMTTKYTQRKNRETERNEMIPHNSSTIPWRIVKGGKYF